MRKLALALGPEGFGTHTFEDGRLTAATGSADTILIPGFVDIHIHGGFGFDFMSASGPDEVAAWCSKLESVGYEFLLPTTVTAAPSEILNAISNLPEHPMIAGFHLEGPFISDRYPGAQPKESIVPISAASEWETILTDPRLRLVTMAPELEGALDLIRRLSARNVIVSMGHTNATYEECRAGANAGATHLTHTYNAMKPLHHREAGTVGFGLLDPSISCELIYDRHHVCREAAELLRRCKPIDKLIGISDGTMASGMPAGSRPKMWGLDAVVEPEGVVRLTDGTLAGSAITLLDAFRNLYTDLGPETAIRACCINPRIDLGLSRIGVWIELDRSLNILDRHIMPS